MFTLNQECMCFSHHPISKEAEGHKKLAGHPDETEDPNWPKGYFRLYDTVVSGGEGLESICVVFGCHWVKVQGLEFMLYVILFSFFLC